MLWRKVLKRYDTQGERSLMDSQVLLAMKTLWLKSKG